MMKKGNELWTEQDTMRCLKYLHDARIDRKVNVEDEPPYASVATRYNDRHWLNEYCKPSTRLYRWQRRAFFKLPLPFIKLWVRVVFTRE
jgi:hypothetical protein